LGQARELLQRLGALDAGFAITKNGKSIIRTGAHPRMANMLEHAKSAREKSLVCDLIALMEARDPFKGTDRFREDWQARWQALAAFRAGRPHGADGRALAAIDFAAKQWRRRVDCNQNVEQVDARELGNLLLHAYTDRVAKVRSDDANRYAMSQGRGGQIAPDSPLRGEPWLIASELDGSGSDARIRRAAPFDPELLQKHYSERFFRGVEQRFEVSEKAVRARELERFDALILNERSVPVRDGSAALAAGIAKLGVQFLPWSDNLQQWRLRAQQVRAWMPELALPDLSDAALADTTAHWLQPFLLGKSKLAQISAEELSQALHSLLDRAQQNAIEQHAPKSITVPSGMTRALEYPESGAPILAVKLQELFGLAETPRVGGGRIPVMLHLLSPGGKPVQVTQDLRNFWNSTYAEVKKEMKGRYPRHPWPDDPWNAPATHRAKPRGT
jgi:ATP-dependent helicase HrpB